jgi:gas vesicle protein
MDNSRGFTYFCLGCAVGAGAAVFFTPKSGPETVNYLRRKASEGSDYIKHRVDDARESVADVAERVTKAARYQVENLGAAAEAGKEAYQAAQQATPSSF